jgi:uncharacterized membrane protein
MNTFKRIIRALVISGLLIVAFLFIYARGAFAQETAVPEITQSASTWDVFVGNILDIAPIFGCIVFAPWLLYIFMTLKATKMELHLTKRERDHYVEELSRERLGVADLRVVK